MLSIWWSSRTRGIKGIPMSLAKIVAALVERGEEDLANELVAEMAAAEGEKVELIFSTKEKAQELAKKLIALNKSSDVRLSGKPSVRKTKGWSTFSLFVTFHSFADKAEFAKLKLYVPEKKHYKDISSKAAVEDYEIDAALDEAVAGENHVQVFDTKITPKQIMDAIKKVEKGSDNLVARLDPTTLEIDSPKLLRMSNYTAIESEWRVSGEIEVRGSVRSVMRSTPQGVEARTSITVNK
jgi:hypothetical protein